MMMKTCLASAMVALLCACSGASETPPAAPVSSAPAGPADTPRAASAPATSTLDAEQIASLKTMLADAGKGCAEITATRALPADNAIDVTCVESAGSTQTVTHRVDLGAI